MLETITITSERTKLRVLEQTCPLDKIVFMLRNMFSGKAFIIIKKHTDAHLRKYLTLFHHRIIVFLGKATSEVAQDCDVL